MQGTKIRCYPTETHCKYHAMQNYMYASCTYIDNYSVSQLLNAIMQVIQALEDKGNLHNPKIFFHSESAAQDSNSDMYIGYVRGKYLVLVLVLVYTPQSKTFDKAYVTGNT